MYILLNRLCSPSRYNNVSFDIGINGPCRGTIIQNLMFVLVRYTTLSIYPRPQPSIQRSRR